MNFTNILKEKMVYIVIVKDVLEKLIEIVIKIFLIINVKNEIFQQIIKQKLIFF